jgi:cytochrome c553
VFVKSKNCLYLLMAALALTPVGATAADKQAVKSSVKAPTAEASEPAPANKPVATHISAAIAALKADPETGRQINGVCAACHGDAGQGGKKGEYPRLAGQHVEYLMDQLKKFKERKRTNLPMFPYTEERERGSRPHRGLFGFDQAGY